VRTRDHQLTRFRDVAKLEYNLSCQRERSTRSVWSPIRNPQPGMMSSPRPKRRDTSSRSEKRLEVFCRCLDLSSIESSTESRPSKVGWVPDLLRSGLHQESERGRSSYERPRKSFSSSRLMREEENKELIGRTHAERRARSGRVEVEVRGDVLWDPVGKVFGPLGLNKS
jgi:hypothetical protein